MKRFASHYLFLPDTGFMKQQVVEITDDGTVQRVFPLTEEVESVEWMPGVIALLPTAPSTTDSIFHSPPSGKEGCPKGGVVGACPNLRPYLFYPFDFTSMQPVAETRHKLLR